MEQVGHIRRPEGLPPQLCGPRYGVFRDLVKFPHEGFVSLPLDIAVRGDFSFVLSASTLNNLQHASHKGNKYFALFEND